MRSVVLFIAWRQLWERKLLSSLAVLGVALGVLVLISVNGMMQGFQRKFVESVLRISPHVTVLDKQLRERRPPAAQLVTGPVVVRVAHESPSDRQLRILRPVEVLRALEAQPGVLAAAGSLVGSAVLALGAQQLPVDLRGVEPAAQARVTALASYVTEGSYRSFEAASDGLLLGVGVATKLGAKLGDVVTASSPLGQPQRLKVVALFDSSIPPVDNARAYVKLRVAQALLGRPDTIGRLELRLSEPERSPAVAAAIERVLGYDAESWQEANANFLSLFVIQNMVIGFVIAAILAVGGFGILAIQAMIVLQKTRDIAILRSVGFRRADILLCFLAQGAAVALVGGLLGAALGHATNVALAGIRTHQEGFVKTDSFLVYDDPAYYVYGLVFALLTGLLASLLPALRGARVEPVDVLRGQLG